MDFFSITAILVSIIFGVISVYFAIKEGKRARRAEQKIVELEQAISSYEYLKNKAFNLYDNGNYKESLDVFKKYLLNNKDDKEWNEIISKIFRKETEKIFSNVFSFKEGLLPNAALLVQAYISFEDKYSNSSPYSVLIKSLISDFTKTFNGNKPPFEFIISLLDKDWEKANKLLPKVRMHKDEVLDGCFSQYIAKYLEIKGGITNDNFADDIPF